MTTYITQEYDFYEAITKNKNLESDRYKGFAIDNVEMILDDKALVETTHGKFICESFEDADANIYMRVTDYH